MKRTNFFLALFLMAISMQTMQAQIMKVWHDGKLDVYDVGIVDSVQFVESHYEWVDLGLPSGTLWATFNVGANAPEEYGDHFAWGETVPKTNYSWDTYKWMDEEVKGWSMITKYTIDDGCTDCSWYNNGVFIGDGMSELLPEDDAATANWGSNWRMPSPQQIGELVDTSYVTVVLTTENGITGRRITSKMNGNSIFLPCAGYYTDEKQWHVGDAGRYWTNSVSLFYPYRSHMATYLYGSVYSADAERRCYGFSVRPVRAQEITYEWPVRRIVLSDTECSLLIDKTKYISATVLPTYAKNRRVTWQSSNSNVASVSESGRVTAKAIGTCIITCSTTDGSGVKAECKVTVKDHDFVDLGLPSGTLWAAYNVGANAPQERGDHFAWGETAPKQDYNWTTYLYSGDTQNTLTKYCTNSEYGTLDNKTELLPEDDAATANWGDKWQMPSILQLEELLDTINNTQIVTVEVEGVRCRKITSRRNGNSIYIPAAGSRFPNRDDFYNDNITGYYWSRTLNTDEPYNARHYIFTYNSKRNWTSSSYYRNTGFTVRAVRKSPMQYVTSIQMDETAIVDLSERRFIRLTATVLPSNATNQTLLWTSSNNNIATVDNTGNVEVVTTSPGTCTITCAATDGSGVKAQCKLTILYYRGTTDGHEWVDLGLPSGTLWATCNLGADFLQEGDRGDYFAWGETRPNDAYTWEAYKYCKGSETSLTKYCPNSEYGYNGFTDNLTELLSEDDAVTANWGRNWKTPSIAQIEELINSDYTTTTWVDRVGAGYGLVVKSKSNGKFIFLPAAGECVEGNDVVSAGEFGRYWSRELEPSTISSWATCLSFYLTHNSLRLRTQPFSRNVGHSIRPVRAPRLVQGDYVNKIELNRTSLKLLVGNNETLTATVYPSYASNPSVVWSSSNTKVAWVDKYGKVHAIAPGTCTIICTAADGSGVTAECQIRAVLSYQGTTDGHGWIDLDLPSGTLWATCNVGTNYEDGYGVFFAWGETQPKDYYSWGTYKYCNGSSSSLTKYCVNSSYGYNGFTDGLYELLPEDDAATANWGSNWQMPSYEQLKELVDSRYTTFNWVTHNGSVNGLEITSKSNGMSIFLPAAGRGENGFYGNYEGSIGHYWLRELMTSSMAYLLDFSSSTLNEISNYAKGLDRSDGHSVRPVLKQ